MARVIAWHGPMLDVRRSGNPNEDTLIEHYRAEMDGPTADPKTDIMSSSQCPAYFQQHTRDTFLMVVAIEVQQNADVQQVYDVEVRWSNKFPSDGQGLQAQKLDWIQNPLQRPAVIEWQKYRTRKTFEFAYSEDDVKDVPVVTANGEPLFMEDEVTFRVIRISKNVAKLPEWWANGADHVNSDNVRIGGIRTPYLPFSLWLTDDAISPLQIENRIPFFTLSFSLYHNPDLWIKKVRHAGYLHKVKTTRKVIIHPGYPDQDPPIPPQWGTLTEEKIKPILVGKPPSYPSAPVPLLPDGTIDPDLRKYLDIEHTPGAERIAIDQKHLQDIIKKSELRFRTKKKLRFNGNVPLK